MTGYQRRKNEKGIEVCSPKHIYDELGLISFWIEDLFGADDADWAIYRKIVKKKKKKSFS